MAERTRRVALTGGIGSGKSEVARMLALRGARIVDADQVARQVVEPGEPALAQIVDAFGPGILHEDGSLNRSALAAMVFPDAAKLARLNAITHPRIAERTKQLLDAAPAGSVVVYDMPLLVEQGVTEGWDLVIVVDAADEVRVRRLIERRGLAERDVRDRMAAQASRQERNNAADVIIDNGGDRDALDVQVADVWRRIRQM